MDNAHHFKGNPAPLGLHTTPPLAKNLGSNRLCDKIHHTETSENVMTTINDISDLIRIIRQDPDWAEALRSVLLSKELLALPETFAAFVSKTRENSRVANQRLYAIETNVAHLTTSQASMGGDLSRLAGRDYESYAARRALLMVANLLELITVKTLSSTSETQWLDDLTLRAQLGGEITHGEALQLQAADLVLEGIVPPKNMTPSTSLEPHETNAVPEGQSPTFYLLAEISMTIQERDMTRAINRAAILHKATGTRTMPLLVGTALEHGLDKGDTVFLEVPDLD